MALTLAIDLGTTNLKAGVINENGEILSLSSAGLETHSAEPGEAEHNPEELKNLVIELCRKVLNECRKEEVEYIISSTYHFGLMLLDEQRKQLTGITLLTDTRSQQTFSDFVPAFQEMDIYEQTGCPLISQYALPRLYYFSKAKKIFLTKPGIFTIANHLCLNG